MSKMTVPFASFAPMYDELRDQLDQAYNNVMNSNYFIQGKECAAFEEEFAAYCDAKYCIGVANGLDAVLLVLKAMEIFNDSFQIGQRRLTVSTSGIIPGINKLAELDMQSTLALELEDVTTPKDILYRLGTTDSPEIKVDFDVQPVIKPVVQKETTIKTQQNNLTYADLSIKKMALC